MPNIVSLGFQTTVTTIAAPCAEIRTDANTRARIREISLFLGAATASIYGIGRPAVRGVGPTAPRDFQPYDPNEVPVAGFLQSAVAWATSVPTVPAEFFKRIGLPAAVGSGVIYAFEELIIPVNGSLVIWNIATNSANLNISVVAEV